MKTLTIYGASDDLIETSGIPGADEFYAGDAEPAVGIIDIKSNSGNLEIVCVYLGSWAFSIHPTDDDCDKMPDWPMRRKFGGEVAYSENVEIDLPDDAVMTFAKLNGYTSKE